MLELQSSVLHRPPAGRANFRRVEENRLSRRRTLGLLCLFYLAVSVGSAHAQSSAESYKPKMGQKGKDVVWIPSPSDTVEKMLDIARITPQDYVIDLGSGDGRNVIAAAKRGAQALGVEFNPDLVALSRRIAASQGVADRATF